MSFVPHGSVLHAHASSSRKGEPASDAELKCAPARVSHEAGFWLDPQSSMAECAFCHHRAFSRLAGYLEFWMIVHARYCAKRTDRQLGRAS